MRSHPIKSKVLKLQDISLSVWDNDLDLQPLLFIHGNSCSKYVWRKLFDTDLNLKYRLIALDLPGHGESSKPKDPENVYNLESLARICSQVLDDLKVKKPIVVGNSLGGHIAIGMLPLPNDIQGLMIFGTPPLILPPEFDKAFLPHPHIAAMYKRVVDRNAAHSIVSSFVENKAEIEKLTDIFLSADPAFREILASNIMKGLGMINEVETLERTTCLVAIVHGEKDGFTNHQYLKRLAFPSLWRNNIAMLTGGHLLAIDNPEGLSQLIRDFEKDLKPVSDMVKQQ